MRKKEIKNIIDVEREHNVVNIKLFNCVCARAHRTHAYDFTGNYFGKLLLQASACTFTNVTTAATAGSGLKKRVLSMHRCVF